MSITAERKEEIIKDNAQAEGRHRFARGPGRDPHRAASST